MSWKESVGRIAFTLCTLVLFTSLIDLFINRLLFRAGPEVLAHMDFPGVTDVAVVGRISFTLEQLTLYVILGSAAILLIRQRDTLPRRLGFLFIPQLASAALLYLPLPLELVWGLSTILVLMTGIEIFGLIVLRGSRSTAVTRAQLAGERAFLIALALGFFFPLYYRVYILFSSINVGALPFGFDAYAAGIYSVMVASVAAFTYALSVPGAAAKAGGRNLAIAVLVPTILVGPVMYGLAQSFFMVQLLSLVIAMSTDIILSFNLVRAIVFFSWFLLASVILLVLKGRHSDDTFLLQQGIGLVLILSTTFLFNYPNYLLLGTTGVLLISFPLLGKKNGDAERVAMKRI